MSAATISPSSLRAIEDIRRETLRAIKRLAAASSYSPAEIVDLTAIGESYVGLLNRVARKEKGRTPSKTPGTTSNQSAPG